MQLKDHVVYLKITLYHEQILNFSKKRIFKIMRINMIIQPKDGRNMNQWKCKRNQNRLT